MDLGSTKHKTVAQIAAEVVLERGIAREGNYSVGWGDPETLDEIAKRATHTTIMNGHSRPDRSGIIPARYRRVLNALENSPLFVKTYIRLHTRCRLFYLKDHVPDFTAWKGRR